MKSNWTICHEFAQGAKSNGRGSNIFYETESNGDRVLYSYGYHFAICRITQNGDCFFTTSRYSVTTAKHISYAHGATSQYTKIFCPDPCSSYNSFRAWGITLERQEKDLAKCINRNKPSRARDIYNTLHQIDIYCEKTGEKIPDYYAHYLECVERMQASSEVVENLKEERRREKERREREERERAERVQAWERGESTYLNWKDTENNVPLRVENKKGYKIILTAKGVRVNIEKAKQFYHALKAGNLKPWDNVETGETTYRVREVTPEVVKVGCHTWQRAYLDNFYKVIANL